MQKRSCHKAVSKTFLRKPWVTAAGPKYHIAVIQSCYCVVAMCLFSNICLSGMGTLRHVLSGGHFTLIIRATYYITLPWVVWWHHKKKYRNADPAWPGMLWVRSHTRVARLISKYMSDKMKDLQRFSQWETARDSSQGLYTHLSVGPQSLVRGPILYSTRKQACFQPALPLAVAQ